MYRPVLVTPPATAPLNLLAVKAHLDVTDGDRDAQIAALLAAAVGYLDGWTGVLGRALVQQTWRQDYDRFSRCMRLPLAPVISITSVQYDDESDVEQTIAGPNYTVLNDDLGPYVKFLDSYGFQAIHVERPAVRITYLAGYATSGAEGAIVSAVPDPIKHAILVLVRHWFDNPGAVSLGPVAQAMPIAVDALIAPFRRVKF